MGKTFTPAEVADSLGVAPSTLRKYSILFEENEITFKRSAQNSRQYTSSDVMALQRMIALVKNESMTVENASYAVAKELLNESIKAVNGNVVSNGSERCNDDITLNEILELKNTIQQQTETIEEFRITQEKRDSYFLKILEDLSGQIQQLKEQQVLPQPEEVAEEAKKEPMKEPVKEKVDPNDRVAKRKSILARLFGKS